MKKVIFLFGLIVIMIIIAFGIKYSKYNKSDGWTYIKYNNALYVLNMDSPEDNEEIIKNFELVGTVNKKIPKYFEPIDNNTSNGIPEDVQIFKDNKIGDFSNIYILVNNKYYPLSNIETAEGWGNGIKANFNDLRG
ncbi:hypothetical protein JJB71_16425 [Clostridium perfringens]|uniref:hypothetical protein n=1 Tax=Clostridium perfringens TaxID=1502 RepID=UPI001ABACB39|nr:hypothetical protein [Clostridium perfringens]MBO3399100.1 hypothetical protein [Clostridium perfringens]